MWLTTEADDQSSLHCIIVLTDVMSNMVILGVEMQAVEVDAQDSYTGRLDDYLRIFKWPQYLYIVVTQNKIPPGEYAIPPQPVVWF